MKIISYVVFTALIFGSCGNQNESECGENEYFYSVESDLPKSRRLEKVYDCSGRLILEKTFKNSRLVSKCAYGSDETLFVKISNSKLDLELEIHKKTGRTDVKFFSNKNGVPLAIFHRLSADTVLFEIPKDKTNSLNEVESLAQGNIIKAKSKYCQIKFVDENTFQLIPRLWDKEICNFFKIDSLRSITPSLLSEMSTSLPKYSCDSIFFKKDDLIENLGSQLVFFTKDSLNHFEVIKVSMSGLLTRSHRINELDKLGLERFMFVHEIIEEIVKNNTQIDNYSFR